VLTSALRFTQRKPTTIRLVGMAKLTRLDQPMEPRSGPDPATHRAAEHLITSEFWIGSQ